LLTSLSAFAIKKAYAFKRWNYAKGNTQKNKRVAQVRNRNYALCATRCKQYFIAKYRKNQKAFYLKIATSIYRQF